MSNFKRITVIALLAVLASCNKVPVLPGSAALPQWSTGPCKYEPGAIGTNKPELLGDIVLGVEATAKAWPTYGIGGTAYPCPTHNDPLSVNFFDTDLLPTAPGRIITGLTVAKSEIRLILNHPHKPEINTVSRTALVHELTHLGGWRIRNEPDQQHEKTLNGWWTAKTNAAISTIEDGLRSPRAGSASPIAPAVVAVPAVPAPSAPDPAVLVPKP